MKTIELKIFKFNELSEESKQYAIEKYRSNNEEFFWQSEWQDVLKKFCDIFPISWSHCDIYQGIDFDIKCDDNIQELSGIRLMKYIQNNYSSFLWKGKYYKSFSYTNEKDLKHHNNIQTKQLSNGKYFQSFYSKIQKENSCVLTGFCGDDDILSPIYEFLKNPKESVTFADLLSDCLNSWLKGVRDDYEGQQTDEYISEHLDANDYDFTEDGEIY
jgi:hypothetical protein